MVWVEVAWWWTAGGIVPSSSLVPAPAGRSINLVPSLPSQELNLMSVTLEDFPFSSEKASLRPEEDDLPLRTILNPSARLYKFRVPQESVPDLL